MGSYDRPPAFGPLDLEIINRVYEATWAQIEARYPHPVTLGKTKRVRRRSAGWLFALAKGGPLDFDTLCDKVIASLPKNWSSAEGPHGLPQVGSQVDAGQPDKLCH